MQRAIILGAMSFCVACGGTSISGTIGGQRITGSHALFFLDSGIPLVAVSDQADLCTELTQNYSRQNETIVIMELFSLDSSGNAAVTNATGDYSVAYATQDATGNETWQPVSTGLVVDLLAAKLDATCMDTLLGTDATTGIGDGVGVGGSVTISKLDTGTDGSIEGSLKVKVGASGDSLTGSFVASYCAYTTAAAATNSTTSADCK